MPDFTRILGSKTPLTLAGLARGAQPLVLADLARAAHGLGTGGGKSGRAVFIAPDDAAMRSITDAAHFFAPELEVLEFPAWDCLPYDRSSPALSVSARRLSALAKFHAQTWTQAGGEAKTRWAMLRDGQSYLREYMNLYLDKPEEWQRFVSSPRGAATSVRFHDLQRMIAAFDRLTELSVALPKCINHGDTHSNNLFVFPDGTPGFFDSLPGWGPAMKEVSYHVTCALDTADRRRWDHALVQHYLDELRGHGVDAPGFDAAMKQFGQFLLNGHIIFLVNESFYQPEAVNTAYTARFSAAMIEHDTLGLLGVAG